MRKIFLVVFFSLLFFSFSVSLVLAWSQCDSEKDCKDGRRIERCCPPPPPEGGLVPCGTPCCSCELCDFFVMLQRIFNFLLFQIIPPLAILMIAIGGGMYIFAPLSSPETLAGGAKGGPKMLSQAKKLLTSVVFGLLIIYGAWIFVNTFFMLIGVAEWTGLKEGWWQIKCP